MNDDDDPDLGLTLIVSLVLIGMILFIGAIVLSP